MASNLPPGVTEAMIPGNRPEDQEIEIVMLFTQGEIDELRQFHEHQQLLPIANRHPLWATVANMIDHFDIEGV